MPAGQVLFSLQGKGQSSVMVKKDPGQREAKTFTPEEGALFFGCVLFDRHLITSPGAMSHTLEQDPGCGLVDN